MTSFHHTVSLITAWLQSCETEEQVNNFPSIIQRFILERFQGKAEQWEIDLINHNLQKEIIRVKEDLASDEKRALRIVAGFTSTITETYITPKGKLIHRLKSCVA